MVLLRIIMLIIATLIMTLIIAPMLIITAIRAKRKAHTAPRAAHALITLSAQEELPH